MNDLAMIELRGAMPAVQLNAAALQRKAAALEKSALLGKVENANENAAAVDVQVELKRVSDSFEAARVEATRPFLEAQRLLKKLVDGHRAELTDELTRVSRLIGDFQALEMARVRAEESARNAELTRIEREREQALAKAKTFEEREAIQAVAEVKAAETQAVVIAPARAAGQVIGEDYNIEIEDIHALYRAHPQCVKLEPKLGEIKLLLKNGVKVVGVKAMKSTKANVRTR